MESKSVTLGVTVVVPVYFGRRFLPTALQSVRDQTLSLPIQLVVVEDGTTPNERSEDIAQQFEAEYFVFETNQGVSRARKFGADRSRFASGYLAFLDQDDRWYPTFLSTLTSTLQQSSAGFVVANMDMVEDTGRTYQLYQTKRPSLRLADLKMFNHIVSPSQVLMRLEAFRTVDWPYPLSQPGADDWLLWLSLIAHGFRAEYVPQPLLAYLDHAGGAHRDSARLDASADSVVRDAFPLLGFSTWDSRRYWALGALNRSLRMRHESGLSPALAQIAKEFSRDFPALTSALWYRIERRLKHWV